VPGPFDLTAPVGASLGLRSLALKLLIVYLKKTLPVACHFPCHKKNSQGKVVVQRPFGRGSGDVAPSI